MRLEAAVELLPLKLAADDPKQTSVHPRIDCFPPYEKVIEIRAKLTKVSDAKPRVLAPSATSDRYEGLQDRRAAEVVGLSGDHLSRIS
jgi:hypothetical protein